MEIDHPKIHLRVSKIAKKNIKVTDSMSELGKLSTRSAFNELNSIKKYF
jgi:hypothetical protein